MLGASEPNKQAALEALREYPGGLQIGGEGCVAKSIELIPRLMGIQRLDFQVESTRTTASSTSRTARAT